MVIKQVAQEQQSMTDQDNINNNNVDKPQDAAKINKDNNNNVKKQANDNSSQNNEKIANDKKVADNNVAAKKAEPASQNNKPQLNKAQDDKSLDNKSGATNAVTNNASKTNTNSVTNKKQSSGKGLTFVALLASMAALGGSGYMYYQDQNDNTGAQVSSVATQVESLATNQSQMMAQQQVSNASLQEANLQIESMVTQIATQEESIAAQVNDWQASIAQSTETANQSIRDELSDINTQLADALMSIKQSKQLLVLDNANALVQGADNQLNIFGSVPTALKALQKAQALIASLDASEIASNGLSNISLSSLNDALSADAIVLNEFLAVETLDVPAALLALIDEVDALTIYVPASEVPAESAATEAPVESVDVSQNTAAVAKPWYSTMKDKVVATVSNISNEIVEDLGSVITVEDVATKIDEPFKPEEEYFLRQNLIAQLENAQQAWLQKNDDVYLANINTAQSWVNKYFDDAQVFAQKLEMLSNSTTAVTLPTIDNSLAAFAAMDTSTSDYTNAIDSKVESTVEAEASDETLLLNSEALEDTNNIEANAEENVEANINSVVDTDVNNANIDETNAAAEAVEIIESTLDSESADAAEVVDNAVNVVEDVANEVSDTFSETIETMVDEISAETSNTETEILTEQNETSTEVLSEENNNAQ